MFWDKKPHVETYEEKRERERQVEKAKFKADKERIEAEVKKNPYVIKSEIHEGKKVFAVYGYKLYEFEGCFTFEASKMCSFISYAKSKAEAISFIKHINEKDTLMGGKEIKLKKD